MGDDIIIGVFDSDSFLVANGKPFNATKHSEFLSVRDSFGHKTHCASTSDGSFVNYVNCSGLALGTVCGREPQARLAMYKVGWIFGDISSVEVLKAFDEVIYDSVDVLSLSLGYDLPLYPEVDKRDVIYYGVFYAVASGITIVCPGENSGLDAGKISNVVPWNRHPKPHISKHGPIRELNTQLETLFWQLKMLKANKQASVDSMIYNYRHGFSGFGAKLKKSQD
ncbi:Peptidase S8 domain-containing protein [Forsythia ovata]|uniref:Peptidase S8 domain-containing protein n=1 Tax=Forsythia ovata TaxID=205694 RepID=A0ABD1X9Z6_9LAMI